MMEEVEQAWKSGMTARDFAKSKAVPSSLTDEEAALLDKYDVRMQLEGAGEGAAQAEGTQSAAGEKKFEGEAGETGGEGEYNIINKETGTLPAYPGDDPAKVPADGYEWRGKGTPGSKQGNWYNPNTKEWLRPDLNHPEPILPHWDYGAPDGKNYRIYPDGTSEMK